jgi:preprotein translocase subunit SecF
MRTFFFLVFVLALLVATSCIKKKKSGDCEFHRLEFVELDADGADMKVDKSVLECLQLEVNEDVMTISNEENTISLKFSVSDENIVEDVDLNIDNDFKKSFDSADEQEMELVEKPKSWEITIKSDNQSKFNGYIKLFKTSDGDYWKQQKDKQDLSSK